MEQNKTFKYPLARDVNLKCIRCKRKIEVLDDHCMNTLAHQSCYDDAGVHDFHVGYGSSQHDTSVFIIGICDSCLTMLSNEGIIYEVGNGIRDLYK